MDYKRDAEKLAKPEDGGFLKPHIFTLTIPQVDGGGNITVKVRWSQKLLYQDGQLTLTVPFSFPEYVSSAVNKMPKKEHIQLNVNSGFATEVLCKTTSHPLKELQRQAGKLGFIYESEVFAWSCINFLFAYSVSTQTFGSVLLQSPLKLDIDRRQMFCLYLFPGRQLSRKAIEMISDTHNSIPMVILITDGAVEDERHICDVMKSHLTNQGSIHPRLFTFGIGSFCNHYFLKMLAIIGRGNYDAAYDADSVESRMHVFFTRASSTVLASLSIESLDGLDELEVYPSRIPDFLSESPLIVSGRYQGDFPNTITAKGILADMSNFSIDLKVQEANDTPLDKVLAKQQIELYTAQAWFSENKELEEKIAKISVQNSIVSEYTRMIFLETESGITAAEESAVREKKQVYQKIIVLHNFGLGFGNLIATAENIPPGTEKATLKESTELFVKASDCCAKLCSYLCGQCCCMCCIRTCSRINDQCAIALTQLVGALSCLGCSACCDACCSGHDG